MENELNEWKNRYHQLEKTNNQDLESFKSQTEARRKSLLNREIRLYLNLLNLIFKRVDLKISI
jgi:hypothetical protein